MSTVSVALAIEGIKNTAPIKPVAATLNNDDFDFILVLLNNWFMTIRGEGGLVTGGLCLPSLCLQNNENVVDLFSCLYWIRPARQMKTDSNDAINIFFKILFGGKNPALVATIPYPPISRISKADINFLV